MPLFEEQPQHFKPPMVADPTILSPTTLVAPVESDEQTPLLREPAHRRASTGEPSIPQPGRGSQIRGSVNATTLLAASITLLAFALPISGLPLSFSDLLQTPPLCNPPIPITDLGRTLGYICAWTSALCYISSRIPQIQENSASQSVEGLSIPMFLLTVFGNIAYGFGIFLRMPVLDSHFWFGTFPYILGSMGTIAFDAVILWQAYTFGFWNGE